MNGKVLLVSGIMLSVFTGAVASIPAHAQQPSATSAKSKFAAGRQRMFERERACGAEWKADKAAGKVPAGMTWPKYWSECNKRKKAQSAK